MAQWARRKRRARVTSLQELAWLHQEEYEMADEKSAYICQVQGVRLITTHAPRPRAECATVDDAVQELKHGKEVAVAARDMGQLRTQLAELGIG